MRSISIYVDGAARGNPGPAGAGGILIDTSGNTIATISQYLGETTNNQAEYLALILALEKALELGARDITIYSDSELMVKQFCYEYRVKDKALKMKFIKAHELLKNFDTYRFIHIQRDKNKTADRLANLAIDQQVLA